ncbi:MAG: single-stranded-DNA-specific exonuclease RecJ, partial [Pseudomonadota bacterium]
MTKQIIRREVNTAHQLPETLHPVLQRIFASRDITVADDIDYSLKGLLPFHELQNIDLAVDQLKLMIKGKKRLLIVADFDTDGATSCALAIRGLNAMGLQDVTYVVPNRFEYGYGLSPEIVDVALEFDPDVIMTVDNGISSLPGVKYAKDQGVNVIITDHHLPPTELPAADVIINPQLSDDKFASKNLAGVGVVFYLLMALRASLREDDWFENENIIYPNLAQMLDLVALGTVADVVPLDKNNRIMLAHGLKLIQEGRARPGIHALLTVAGKSARRIDAATLGFAIAPRMNAAGRLTDMSLGIECLLSDDRESAMDHARQLDKLNMERRQIQDEMQAQALIQVDNSLQKIEQKPAAGICIYHHEWHQGVIGILAAKVKDRFNRPVIVFAKEMDNKLKGSARSIEGLHIRDLLESIAMAHPDLVITFGGHAMAAGLTIAEASFNQFKNIFENQVERLVSPAQLQEICITDGELNPDELSIKLAAEIQTAGPWGQAFPEPLFDGCFYILDKKVVGGSHLKLRLQMNRSSKPVDAICFNMTDNAWPDDIERIKAAYRLSINEYQNRENLQLVIEQIEP